MDELDGAAGRGAAGLAGGGLADQQARANEPIDDAVDLAGVGRQLVELAHRHDRAGALGGDQAQEQRTDQGLLARRALGDHGVGVAGERTGDAADAVVAVGVSMAAVAVARLPQLAGGELEQRQRARGVLEVIEHRLDHRRHLELIAGHLGGLDQRVAQAVAARAASGRTGRG